jgi:hypothetical protein
MPILAIRHSVECYERWLADRLPDGVVKADIDEKHRKMRKSPFHFLRATCWRWAERAHSICPDLLDAPTAAAVGDLHIENFGLWRDDEGRLVWGVNDFDEAAMLPYPLDLVRLCASAVLATQGLEPADAAKSLLDGYRFGLSHPNPIVLENKHLWLRKRVMAKRKERTKFWSDLASEVSNVAPPKRFAKALKKVLPDDLDDVKFSPRQAGCGSLGRPRFVALANYRGAPLAREAKALVPSCFSAFGSVDRGPADPLRVMQGPHRSPDPKLFRTKSVIVRRLAPDSTKLDDDRRQRVIPDLLEAMGQETANIHGISGRLISDIEADLETRRNDWLGKAADNVVKCTNEDHEAYKIGGRHDAPDR